MADINDTNNSFSCIHDFIVFLSFHEYFLSSVVFIACKESSTPKQLQREVHLK